MPVAMPQVVRRGWGEEVVAAFVPWLKEEISETVKEKAVPRDEYREVLSRLDLLEKDISLVKEEQARMRVEFREDQVQMRAEFREDQAQMRAEFREDQAQMRAEFREDLGQLHREMNERFDGMHERFDGMNQHFESRLDQMSERMLVQTRWLIGSIALFGTILTIMMAIAQFMP